MIDFREGPGPDPEEPESRQNHDFPVTPSGIPSLLSPEQWRTIARHLNLKADGQEIRILQGVMANLSDAAIEHALKLSHGCVREYMGRLFLKANLPKGQRTRLALAMRALEPVIRGS